MRQTTCPRHERRQRRGLKQDPRGCEQAKVPANECHSDPDQPNETPPPKQLGDDSPQIVGTTRATLSRSRFPAKTGSLSSRARADRVNAYAISRPATRFPRYSMTMRPLKIGSFSFVWS
jgi:hypothetical protein